MEKPTADYKKSQIFTIEQAQQNLTDKKFVTSIHFSVKDKEAVFFTNDHCYPEALAADSWVPISTYFRNGFLAVKPRKGLESGRITNMRQYIDVFHYDDKIIESEEELLEFIKGIKPYLFEEI